MDSSFFRIIEEVFNSKTMSESEKKALIGRIESEAVSTYMKKIDSALSLNHGTADGPLVAAALKLHYDLITHSMNPHALDYTNSLAKRMAGKIQYVNITIDINALRQSLNPDFNPDDFPDTSDENK